MWRIIACIWLNVIIFFFFRFSNYWFSAEWTVFSWFIQIFISSFSVLVWISVDYKGKNKLQWNLIDGVTNKWNHICKWTVWKKWFWNENENDFDFDVNPKNVRQIKFNFCSHNFTMYNNYNNDDVKIPWHKCQNT